MTEVKQLAQEAKTASQALGLSTTSEKNEALQAMAREVINREKDILAANDKDVAAGKQKGLSDYLLDRLRLSPERLQSMSKGLQALMELPDPLAVEPETWTRQDGLVIENRRVPLGVIAMVYEARPNVTVDAAGLCLKAGNAALLRGSSSAVHSNEALVGAMKAGLKARGLPETLVQLVNPENRDTVRELGQMRGLVDVIIPRGGAGLIQTVLEQSSVPVIETGIGNCHVYIEASAKKEMAISIAVDAKTDRPSVCNAAETILVDEQWATANGSALIEALLAEGVAIRGDENIQRLHDDVKQASEEDWATEYLAPVVALGTVPDTEAAIAHVRQFGTTHSEAIVTENEDKARAFQNQIDASSIYHNASTRFTDGAEFGFGAEIGISTQKLHARGPLGLGALTTNKYVISGHGHVKGGTAQ
ncbi:glutamate-5-semialdehyde dehydrogenase [Salicibibacter halophilus]|uniref:Gamma-glutamyl phosphate reductase n=1 Tax=Salicibibacter halophilus TaxID=2502791 RepID=A0A514LFK9_9BACI|nr:glutamate-5-semialdehyde dehydrogenase [Salicibibacter halophilus]QDI90622.1 glutamate-5-semialdehyde dehydrogenase [Salicibibacter halophilus]